MDRQHPHDKRVYTPANCGSWTRKVRLKAGAQCCRSRTGAACSSYACRPKRRSVCYGPVFRYYMFSSLFREYDRRASPWCVRTGHSPVTFSEGSCARGIGTDDSAGTMVTRTYTQPTSAPPFLNQDLFLSLRRKVDKPGISTAVGRRLT